MARLILVTGGARSGKSAFAEELARQPWSGDVLYLATAAIFDEEMAGRVAKHRLARPASWATLERHRGFESLGREEAFLKADTVLVDCIGYMLNNIMFETVKDYGACTILEMEETEKLMLAELDYLCKAAERGSKTMIFVTNEIGMGIVPADRGSRYYRDILGRSNQLLAGRSTEVYFLVSGIPMKIKGD